MTTSESDSSLVVRTFRRVTLFFGRVAWGVGRVAGSFRRVARSSSRVATHFRRVTPLFRRFPRHGRRVPRYSAAMAYLISNLVEETGVAPRTIREYIQRGMMKPPHGRGLGATYDEEHLARLTVIARMRAKGDGLDTIAARIARWSVAKLEKYIAADDAAKAAADTPPPPEAQANAHAPPPASLPPPARPHDVENAALIGGGALPDGPRFVLATLLPGLALMVDEEASPLVRRIAGEICERYGMATRTAR